MPVVNIGTASNLFSALNSSLEKHGLDCSRAVAFMSDLTNVMKGGRSGVQKLVKAENPHLYDSRMHLPLSRPYCQSRHEDMKISVAYH